MGISSTKRPIKVLFILPTLHAGGAERVLITLMNFLNREQFEPVFVAINNEGPLRNLISKDIQFHSLDGKKVSLSFLNLYKKLKEIRPDIVVSTMAHVNFMALLIKPFFKKTKFVVREAVTPSYFSQKYLFKPFIIRMAYRVLYPYADLVISPAQMIIDEFKKDLGLACNNHALLYNPVNTANIWLQKDEKDSLSELRKSAVHFVASGRLHPQKGFDRLIQSLPQLRLEYDWKISILGEGEERNTLENLINDLGLSKHVHLLGLQDTPWPFYAYADCFLLPSRFEGLPNVVLESLACGTPVIAMRSAGGIMEIAEASSPGAVTVVDTMADFIEAMESVQPCPSETFRDSLLPRAFECPEICNKFEGLLKDLVHHS